MLLIKSDLISEIFFCLNACNKVTAKTPMIIKVNKIDNMIDLITEARKKALLSGKIRRNSYLLLPFISTNSGVL